MGFWKELKKEWTWSSIKKQWSDFLAIFIAAAIAGNSGKMAFGFIGWYG